MRRSVALLTLLMVGSLPGKAEAQEGAATARGSVVRPGTRAMFGAFSIAPALSLDPYSKTQVKLAQSFGYHFSGDTSGFALGLEIQESIGGGAFGLVVGPKLWFDIQLADLGLYLSPCVLAGLGYASTDGYFGYGGYSGVGFDLQLGFEAKLVLGDRGLVFFRPVTLDLGIGERVLIRWDLAFGGGVTF